MTGYVTTTSGAYPGSAGQTAQAGYRGAMNLYANTPFAPYTGQLVPGNNQSQDGAANSLVPQTGYQAPNVGVGLATQYAGGTGAGNLSTNGMNLSGYMSPYTQQVINTTMTGLNNQLATTNAASDAAATRAGAFGGDRAAIVNAQNAMNTNQIAASTIAGLNQANFGNAQTQAQTDLNRQLQGGTTQAQLGLQADQGNQFASIQGANLRDSAANSLYQMGTQQQQMQLQSDQAGLGQWQARQQWPLQMAGLGAQTTGQYNPALTFNGTQTQTTPGPSTLSQVAGGLTSAAGLYGLLNGGGSGSTGGGLIGGLGSAYNSVFGSGGSGAGAGGGTATSINGTTVDGGASSGGASGPIDISGTDGSGSIDTSGTSNGDFWTNFGTGFRNGGAVGYAEGGAVDNDGTYVPVDDNGDDDERGQWLPGGLPPQATDSSGGVVVSARDRDSRGGGGLAAAAAIIPPRGPAAAPGGGLAGYADMAARDMTAYAGDVPPPDQTIPPQGIPDGVSPPTGASTVIGPYSGDANTGLSQVNPGGLAGMLDPGATPLASAPPGGLAGAAAINPTAPPAGTTPPDGMGYDGQPLPVPPVPPQGDGAPAPAGLGGTPSRLTQSADPSSTLPTQPGTGTPAPATPVPGQGLQGVQQPRQGSPGAPGAVGDPNASQGDFIDRLYGRGGNSWALPVLAAGAAMLSSRDPHFGVALGQGLQGGLAEANQVYSGRQQAALKMLQMQQMHDYQLGMLGVRQQNAKTSADRAGTYANISDARTQLALAQTAVANAKAAAGPHATTGDVMNAAVQDLISKGMSPSDAYAQVKNYTATNDYRAARVGQIDNAQSQLAQYRQNNLQFRQQNIARLQQANVAVGVRNLAMNLLNNGKAKDADDAIRQASAAIGQPAQAGTPTPSTNPTPAYQEGQTATNAQGQKVVFQGGQWQPAQ